ncbi:MAG: methyl viologen-reducing hydrogenase [Magnetococcales bacterium]|nr:methyl viologen-reducing hydrogenase [Magnetococcales bacterium]
MSEKKKLSIEWLSGCSGCEVGLVDLHEKLLNVLDEVDLVRIPILMDIKGYPKADVGMITGSIRTEHDLNSARKMREACDVIIAFGTCPVYGGPHSGGYADTPQELLDVAFCSNPSTVTTDIPDQTPKLLDQTLPIDAEIEVDLYMPGCPPHPGHIFDGLMSLLRGQAPKIPRYTVCYNCDRKMKKSDVTTLRRTYEGPFDPDICFLTQGCLCFGSASLDRCMAPCPKSGVPCFSCGGPSEPIILEPPKDVRTRIAHQMSHLTKIPHDTIVAEIESQAKTHYAYAMASPVFRQKPTFLFKKWTQKSEEA